ncbi:MAG TPA: hypothetical protein VNL35_03995 [Chloroflexota bacterium]|nr:hypothetical protein [Chloroflexota bacterium]
MTRRRSIRLLVSAALTALMLGGAPWARGASAQGVPGLTANQTLTMSVAPTGVLTVSVINSTVSWNYPSAADLGQLSFTNTLNDGAAWSISAAMTDLVPTSGPAPASCVMSSTNCLSFTNMTLASSSLFNPLNNAPTTNMVHGGSGAFGGTDTTPGTTLSNTKQVLTADGTDKGSYTQGDGTAANDSSITPATGLALESGTYSGTLQYTITG